MKLRLKIIRGTWIRSDIDATMLDDRHARREALDSVAPAHPVVPSASTGHGVLMNSAALRVLGIRDDEPDPVGGFYERAGAPFPGRGRGRITGLMHEYAGWNALRTLRARQSETALVGQLQLQAGRAARFGITSSQDMANALDPATTFRVLNRARLPLRVRVIAMPATDRTGRLTREWQRAVAAFDSAGRREAASPRPTVSGVKWISTELA